MKCFNPMRVLIFFQVIFILFGCMGEPQKIEQQIQTPESIKHKASASLGIETIAIRQTAAGNMLDFRFRVLESAKAMPLFREDIKPYLIAKKTGKTLKVTDTTKVGPMRPTSRDPKAGKTYFMFFGNPNKSIQPGDKVTVVIGEQRIENLVVE